jgi:hypothetical protein
MRALVHTGAVDQELSEKMAYHLELETKKNISLGMKPDEARRQARIAFGPEGREVERRHVVHLHGARIKPFPRRGGGNHLAVLLVAKRHLIETDVAAQNRQFNPPVGGTVAPVSDPVGYRLRVERTVRERLTFILDAESRPFFYGVIGGGWDGDSFAARTRVPYVSDASARVQETGLTVETRPLRGFTLGLGGNAGHVEGRVAPSLPDAEITRAYEEGDLRFTVARFEGRLESTGTQVLVHMMRIDARSGASGAVVRDDDRRMEFDLVQDLPFHPAGTQWTLLASYRSDTQDDPGVVLRADSGRWGAGSRVSGGVAVKF